MKKLFLIIIIAAFPMLSIFSKVDSISKSVMIQAGYGEVVSMEIDRIPAQSTGYIAGMPFNIEESFVQSTQEIGRLIAHFSILSNTRYEISIKSTPMRHMTGALYDADAYDLHYNLTFDYILGYRNTESSSEESQRTVLTYNSRTDTNEEADWKFDTSDYTDGNYIGTVNGSIYFRFDSGASSYIQGEGRTALPAGNYAADVTFEIRTVG